ncbi:hypothetical protein BT67DRAFT_21000 [Trichocladium antarcticum]|uniref:Uncharacterized protein n=1 Tax=Trichocladium antarcticum TaxID=1450529 RepID=A0AAN6UT49_9PEZI|nr:hypothetical protein BT67DRAFT_21000 [Trichocladium antarcticum]
MYRACGMYPPSQCKMPARSIAGRSVHTYLRQSQHTHPPCRVGESLTKKRTKTAKQGQRRMLRSPHRISRSTK